MKHILLLYAVLLTYATWAQDNNPDIPILTTNQPTHKVTSGVLFSSDDIHNKVMYGEIIFENKAGALYIHLRVWREGRFVVAKGNSVGFNMDDRNLLYIPENIEAKLNSEGMREAKLTLKVPASRAATYYEFDFAHIFIMLTGDGILMYAPRDVSLDRMRKAIALVKA